jgi:hypothetical protein
MKAMSAAPSLSSSKSTGGICGWQPSRAATNDPKSSTDAPMRASWWDQASSIRCIKAATGLAEPLAVLLRWPGGHATLLMSKGANGVTAGSFPSNCTRS